MRTLHLIGWLAGVVLVVTGSWVLGAVICAANGCQMIAGADDDADDEAETA